MRLLPDLSRGAEDQGWDRGGQSAGDERESHPFQLGSSHPGTNLGREAGLTLRNTLILKKKKRERERERELRKSKNYMGAVMSDFL